MRQRVLDAAEQLLREGKADFSMRDLASAAGVSFATPFNHFANKAGIMYALSTRRIDTMAVRIAAATLPADAASRVLLSVDIAVAVMLEEPRVNRAVMGSIGTPGASTGEAMVRSAGLWSLALGDGAGLAAARRKEGLRILPGQLALAFRGALSFWTAGELVDDELGPRVREIASTLVSSFGSDPSARLADSR